MEEYLQTGYHFDFDFVDGHIEERNVGERDHISIQMILGAWFLSREAD